MLYRITLENGIMKERRIKAAARIAFEAMFWFCAYLGDRVAGFSCKVHDDDNWTDLTDNIRSDYLRGMENIDELCVAPLRPHHAREMLCDALYSRIVEGEVAEVNSPWEPLPPNTVQITGWAIAEGIEECLYALYHDCDNGKYILRSKRPERFGPVEIADAMVITRKEVEATA